MSQRELDIAAQELGFPTTRDYRTHQRDPGMVHLDPSTVGRKGDLRPGSTAVVTVCSINHLYFMRTLASSLAEFHPEIDVFAVIADWDGEEPLESGSATCLAAGQLGIDHFLYRTLDCSAYDLCACLKPPGIRHVAALGYEKILHLDSDLYIFAPMTALLEALEAHQFVVTPHTLAPLPHPERIADRPNLEDLTSAGVYNTGLFGLRVNAETMAFVDTWDRMTMEAGITYDYHFDQRAFSWVSSFLEDVHVFRNTAYNAAYWNLHDRSLRYRGLDDETLTSWEVDGQPLVAFHFSGFDFDNPTELSRHDSRHSLYVLPSLAKLTEFYASQLARHGALEMRQLPYRFKRFPSGIEIDERMRQCFRKHKIHLWRDLDPWTEEGEAYFCRALLLPTPTTCMIPLLIWAIYEERPDLAISFPESKVDPSRLIKWFGEFGSEEFGYTDLIDRHRPTVPKLEGALQLQELRRTMPKAFEGLKAPLGENRWEVVNKLNQAGEEGVALRILRHEYEYYDLSQIYLAREVVRERTELRLAYPDFLFDDSEALANWFGQWGMQDHLLPKRLAETFRAKANGRSLARIFSFVNRTWFLMESYPLAFVGEGRERFAQTLMEILPGGPEFDFDDIVMYLWVMEEKPWAGIPLTFELLYNTHHSPSPLLPQGQESLLARVLDKDPRFADALEAYQKQHSTEKEHFDFLHAMRRLRPVPVLEGRPHPVLDDRREVENGQLRGVNFFGYFKSPIGLGNFSRGLARAMEAADIPVQKNLVGNVAMEADLIPADFIRTYRHAYDVNVFASYPHLHERLTSMYPRWALEGRTNIVYLAWEQRDGSHYWADIYSGFDQVWALSTFTAEALSRCMGREVLPVPCVVDYDSFPEAAAKADVGLDPSRFVFLYIFDANSSMERKNPEAAIEAFAQAFKLGEPAQLILKVSNHYRHEHQRRLRYLMRKAAATGLDIRFLFQTLPHDDLLRLISAADCYVSLHHAEGFGYTIAEALGYGLPVIATRYSGNLEYMDDDNSFLVDYEEATVQMPDGPFQRGSIWADPSVEHAATLMRQVYDDREAARAKGQQAAQDVRERLSAERVGAIVRRALGFGE